MNKEFLTTIHAPDVVVAMPFDFPFGETINKSKLFKAYMHGHPSL